MIEQGFGGVSNLFYASVCEVFPDDPRKEIWPTIVEIVQNWIIEKERHRRVDTQGRQVSHNERFDSKVHVDIPQILKWTPGSRLSAHSVRVLREGVVKKSKRGLSKAISRV